MWPTSSPNGPGRRCNTEASVEWRGRCITRTLVVGLELCRWDLPVLGPVASAFSTSRTSTGSRQVPATESERNHSRELGHSRIAASSPGLKRDRGPSALRLPGADLDDLHRGSRDDESRCPIAPAVS